MGEGGGREVRGVVEGAEMIMEERSGGSSSSFVLTLCKSAEALASSITTSPSSAPLHTQSRVTKQERGKHHM